MSVVAGHFPFTKRNRSSWGLTLRSTPSSSNPHFRTGAGAATGPGADTGGGGEAAQAVSAAAASATNKRWAMVDPLFGIRSRGSSIKKAPSFGGSGLGRRTFDEGKEVR